MSKQKFNISAELPPNFNLYPLGAFGTQLQPNGNVSCLNIF